jgi:hypothetical protein
MGEFPVLKTIGLMAMKSAGVTTAAAAAGVLALSSPAYAATGFDAVPMKHHHHDGNSIQVPIQACNNNLGNNNAVGILGHGKAKGGNNKGKCKQKTSSH